MALFNLGKKKEEKKVATCCCGSVNNKAEENNGKVVSADVSIYTSICPECGRSYVSGGETRTQITYNNESNPYQAERKCCDEAKYKGININAAC